MLEDDGHQEARQHNRYVDLLGVVSGQVALDETCGLNEIEIDTIWSDDYLFQMWERGESVARIKAEIMEVWR